MTHNMSISFLKDVATVLLLSPFVCMLFGWDAVMYMTHTRWVVRVRAELLTGTAFHDIVNEKCCMSEGTGHLQWWFPTEAEAVGMHEQFKHIGIVTEPPRRERGHHKMNA